MTVENIHDQLLSQTSRGFNPRRVWQHSFRENN